jgi:transposase
MIRHHRQPELLRLEVVRYAQERGIKPAARHFGMAVNTVRKWVRRFDNNLASLRDRCRAPHRIPHKIAPEIEAQIVQLRHRLPTWGAERLQRDFQLPCSGKAVARVLRQRGLTRRRKRKHQTKQRLREVKKHWALFQQISIDTKDLYDIPAYWSAMTHHRLPRCQYTAREVVSGLTFLAFAQERSLTYATLFAERILRHLRNCGVDLSRVTFQSDNGSEFVGSWQQKGPSSFTHLVQSQFGASHRTIPPAAHTFQSDVETLHRLIEDEFFDIESFHHRHDFLTKAITYQLFFNVARSNSGKEHQTPLQILRLRTPNLDPRLVLLPPVFLEDLLHRHLSAIHSSTAPGGHHLPSLPSDRGFWLEIVVGTP